MGDKHPLVEFTQGFLDTYDGVDYTRPEDREEIARNELERKFGDGNDEVNQDVEPAGLGRGGREIPDPPSLDDIDVDVGPGRGQGEQATDDAVGVAGSTGGGIDHSFRPEEGISRADFVDLYERDKIAEKVVDKWSRYLQPGEYLTRKELRSLADEGEMFDFIKRTCLEVLDGERLTDVPRRPASDYGVGEQESGSSVDLHDLDSDQLLSLLEEMVRRGEISGEEARKVFDEVDEGGGGLASTEDSYGEMTGKFPNDEGQSGDPEVEKLDEMLNRFRD